MTKCEHIFQNSSRYEIRPFREGMETFKCTIVKFGMWIISGMNEDNFCDINSLLFGIIFRKRQYHHYIEIEFVRLEARI